MRYSLLFSILLPFSAFMLETSPWFKEVYEFYFLSKYTYSRYSEVSNATAQLTSSSNDNLLLFNLSFAPAVVWNLDFDFELAQTPRQDFGFRSFAFQFRRAWLDDVIGDPFAFDTGLNLRSVSGDSLRDVSCPYHGNLNLELNTALGKEMSHEEVWAARIYLYLAGGIANYGSPYLRALGVIAGNIRNTSQWKIFADFYKGYGSQVYVDIEKFHGYGHIRHSSLDIGVQIGYKFEAYGVLSFEYKRRVVAKSFPENVNFFAAGYLLPFSF